MELKRSEILWNDEIKATIAEKREAFNSLVNKGMIWEDRQRVQKRQVKDIYIVEQKNKKEFKQKINKKIGRVFEW